MAEKPSNMPEEIWLALQSHPDALEDNLQTWQGMCETYPNTPNTAEQSAHVWATLIQREARMLRSIFEDFAVTAGLTNLSTPEEIASYMKTRFGIDIE